MICASSTSLRQQHLRRDIGGFGVELLDELGHHLAVGFVFGAFQDEIFPPDQLAAADEEDLHAGFAVGARHGDHIRIHLLGGDHLLLFHHLVDGLDLVAQRGGLLEAQVLGGLLHLLCRRSTTGSVCPSRNWHRSSIIWR